MNETKVRGMLGLAVRARQLCFGEEACGILVRKGKCAAVFLDGEAGPNTRKKTEAMCKAAGIPLVLLPEGMIGQATGRSNRIAALQKGAFAEQMTGCLL